MARLNPDEVLDAAKAAVVAAQADLVTEGSFYLAGGTGLALHLGHRLSRDLDWFTAQRFDGTRLCQELPRLALAPTTIVQSDAHTVRAYYGELETSFIRYSQVTAHPSIIEVGDVQVPVADIETLAAMKAGAIINRGAKRDFIDLQALSQHRGWSVQRIVSVAETKLGLSKTHLCRGLTYFVDADKQPMPDGVTVTWDVVKRDIFRDVQALTRHRGPDLGR